MSGDFPKVFLVQFGSFLFLWDFHLPSSTLWHDVLAIDGAPTPDDFRSERPGQFVHSALSIYYLISARFTIISILALL